MPDQESFAPDELAIVLSHYDVGVVRSAKRFARGSRRSPKLLLEAEAGRFLLKRRARGRDNPQRVALAHALILHLLARGFPVPELVGTRREHNSMLQLSDRVYELFAYAEGEAYDGSLEQTSDAGRVLARFHREVADFHSQWDLQGGSFHNSAAIRAALNAIPSTMSGHDSVVGYEAELLALTQDLHERYDNAAELAERAGLSAWPLGIVHGDWHPGNMLFRGGHVAAVLDFDSARQQPAVVDVANGMLQFSVLRGRNNPELWPEFSDESRMRRFQLGYLGTTGLAADWRRVVPDLMVESLIAEAVLPIAATGSFGTIPGFSVLRMVRRKVGWLARNREHLLSWMLD